LGSQGALLGLTLGSPLPSWDAGGLPWATLGFQVELGMTLGQNEHQLLAVFGALVMPAHKK
tara:strand:- start:292 stop:474 length:183 start_codon:yes stop_codon:yes gene_type:complete